jgi:hypothetical protein
VPKRESFFDKSQEEEADHWNEFSNEAQRPFRGPPRPSKTYQEPPRREPSRDQRDQRKPSRDQREPSRDQREPSRDQREPSRDQREPSRDQREPSRDQREPSRDQREPPRNQKDPITSQESFKNDPPRGQREPLRHQKGPSRDQKGPSRDQREPLNSHEYFQNEPLRDIRDPTRGQRTKKEPTRDQWQKNAPSWETLPRGPPKEVRGPTPPVEDLFAAAGEDLFSGPGVFSRPSSPAGDDLFVGPGVFSRPSSHAGSPEPVKSFETNIDEITAPKSPPHTPAPRRRTKKKAIKRIVKARRRKPVNSPARREGVKQGDPISVIRLAKVVTSSKDVRRPTSSATASESEKQKQLFKLQQNSANSKPTISPKSKIIRNPRPPIPVQSSQNYVQQATKRRPQAPKSRHLFSNKGSNHVCNT